MPDSKDKPFRPNERVAETLANASHQRMQETMRRRPSVAAPLYQTTVGRRNPTDGLYPRMNREEEWRLVRQVSRQLTPEGERAVKEQMTRNYSKVEATLKEQEKNRVEAMLKKTHFSKEIGGATEVTGKPVPNDPTPIDKSREIGQSLQNKGLIKPDIEPGKE